MACRCSCIAQGRALGRTRSELAHKQPAANVVSILLPTSPSLPCSPSSPSPRLAPNLSFVLAHTLIYSTPTSSLRLADTGTAHNEDDPLVSRTRCVHPHTTSSPTTPRRRGTMYATSAASALLGGKDI
ncbi:hypothetical protein C8F04DRAFT_1258086 [Mycena alexandri]|uniref:Uncharacterized protein n=1 Tax=Mycena alexandri TaxID=1745969 RepID=A0AAD6SY72_9AGAR|nr:hypothetical protein C8F04DRAFT_1258086 [Mycena alexandri]